MKNDKIKLSEKDNKDLKKDDNQVLENEDMSLKEKDKKKSSKKEMPLDEKSEKDILIEEKKALDKTKSKIVEKGKTSNDKNKKNIIIFIAVLIIIIIAIILLIPSKGNKMTSNINSSLNKVVKKSNLETITINYNVIAKQCFNSKKCNLKSNNIDNFKYVVSCQGSVTAGIDFSKVKIKIDSKNKKIIVSIPEATLTDSPSVGSLKFLNGSDVSADELPKARELCQTTIKSRSEKDDNLLAAAKEQAKVVLSEYYKQWIKSYDDSYKVVFE